MNNPTISQVTKCIKRNKQNIQINLNAHDEFTQGFEFVVYREKKEANEDIKTISSNILNDTSSVINYNFNEIIDIPKKMEEIFDNQLGSNYYLFGVNKENSFLVSLLYVISKEFKLKQVDKQLSFSKELLELLVNELPNYFRNNKYSSYGFKMTSIIENLQTNCIDEGVLRYLYDYYNINIVVLDYNNEKYLVGDDYNNNFNEKNVIIIKNENIYLPLVNMFGSMPTKLLYKCILNKLKINKEINVVKTNIMDSSNKSNKLSLKALSSYKLGDLQLIAKENNISICEDANGKTKNKTKQVLYNELVSL
jgi:hypothetical protein